MGEEFLPSTYSLIKKKAFDMATNMSYDQINTIANQAYKSGDKLLFSAAERARELLRTSKFRQASSALSKTMKGAQAIGPVLSILASAQGGWGLGRKLGQTPLITDPNMTYDDFYSNLFESLSK